MYSLTALSDGWLLPSPFVKCRSFSFFIENTSKLLFLPEMWIITLLTQGNSQFKIFMFMYTTVSKILFDNVFCIKMLSFKSLGSVRIFSNKKNIKGSIKLIKIDKIHFFGTICSSQYPEKIYVYVSVSSKKSKVEQLFSALIILTKSALSSQE